MCMNFEKPEKFDEEKAVRFDELKIGDMFITKDASLNGVKYSERVYCKVPEFSNGGTTPYNAIGVTEPYSARMMSCEKVVRVKVDYWSIGD